MAFLSDSSARPTARLRVEPKAQSQLGFSFSSVALLHFGSRRLAKQKVEQSATSVQLSNKFPALTSLDSGSSCWPLPPPPLCCHPVGGEASQEGAAKGQLQRAGAARRCWPIILLREHGLAWQSRRAGGRTSERASLLAGRQALFCPGFAFTCCISTCSSARPLACLSCRPAARAPSQARLVLSLAGRAGVHLLSLRQG